MIIATSFSITYRLDGWWLGTIARRVATSSDAHRIGRFAGVTESNFPSILRRSLIWKPRARFLDAAYLRDHYPNHEQDGVFAKNPKLREFLVSGPACAAGIRIQHGFECTHSREDCEALIEGDMTTHHTCNWSPSHLQRLFVVLQRRNTALLRPDEPYLVGGDLLWGRMSLKRLRSTGWGRRLDRRHDARGLWTTSSESSRRCSSRDGGNAAGQPARRPERLSDWIADREGVDHKKAVGGQARRFD